MFCFFSKINNPILLSVEFHILMDSLLFRLVRAAHKKGANIILIQVGRLCWYLFAKYEDNLEDQMKWNIGITA